MLRQKLLLFFIAFISLGLLSCTDLPDAGIIQNWHLEDDVLDWDDVKDAQYYQFKFFLEDGTEDVVSNTTPIRTYDSAYDFYRFSNQSDLFFKIEVILEDGSKILSELIQLTIERPFPRPKYVGGDYIQTQLTWDSYGSERADFLNYTLIINDQEHVVETSMFDMSDYEPAIYEITIIANYEGGSSLPSKPHYLFWRLDVISESIYYDVTQPEDLVYDLADEAEVFVIRGKMGVFHEYLPESVAYIEDNQLIVSSTYITTEANQDGPGPILLVIEVLSESYFYTIYLTKTDLTT